MQGSLCYHASYGGLASHQRLEFQELGGLTFEQRWCHSRHQGERKPWLLLGGFSWWLSQTVMIMEFTTQSPHTKALLTLAQLLTWGPSELGSSAPLSKVLSVWVFASWWRVVGCCFPHFLQVMRFLQAFDMCPLRKQPKHKLLVLTKWRRSSKLNFLNSGQSSRVWYPEHERHRRPCVAWLGCALTELEVDMAFAWVVPRRDILYEK
mgnify:CR=1 FL=1